MVFVFCPNALPPQQHSLIRDLVMMMMLVMLLMMFLMMKMLMMKMLMMKMMMKMIIMMSPVVSRNAKSAPLGD